MDARLIVVGGKANKSEVKLKLPTTIGRSRTADLTVAHPKVSRQHCQIFERDGLLVVRDNGSLNGTYIEEAKITESVLKPGEKLTVGPLTFIAAYEPAHADAGLPNLDPPTPLFEPDAANPSQPVAVESPPAANEGEEDAWLDDSPGFSASYEDPPPDSSSWFPEPAEPLGAEPPLTFDNLAAPPAAAPDASDFRLPEVSELAETMPADPPGKEAPHAADVTVDLPPPTVAFEPPAPAPAPDPAPRSPDDFRAAEDDAGEIAFELPPPTVSPAADEAPAEEDEQPWLPAAAEQTVESDDTEEPFGWSPDASQSQAPTVSSETVHDSGLDKTTEMMPSSPPTAIDATDQEVAEAGDSPEVATPGSPDASSDRTGKSKGWWPFGGKKKNSAKATSSGGAVEPISAEPTSPLPSEAQSLHTGTLTPIVPPAAEVDESAPAENEPSTADDEELSQFLKSLGN